MNNKHSLAAYFDPANKKKFNSHSGMIVRELRIRPNQSRYQLSRKIFLDNHAIQKRLSDLKNLGFVEESGETDESGNTCATYRIKEQLDMFYIEKLPLRKWLSIDYPEILHKYEVLYERKL
jgi:hypothetical protein